MVTSLNILGTVCNEVTKDGYNVNTNVTKEDYIDQDIYGDTVMKRPRHPTPTG